MSLEQGRPNPDEVLGIEIVDQPFDANKTPRWDDPRIKPKLVYQAEEDTDNPSDLA